MYVISTDQRQYLTYVLQDTTQNATLEVVPERGGIITRWQTAGHDLLYLDAERFADPDLSIRGGIPILFPICGNLPDNAYNCEGQTYRLKQHGFARNVPWIVTAQQTETDASLSLQLTSDEHTLMVYPFEFVLDFTYRLQGTSLVLHQRYTNRSQAAMPFSIGFHPYFAVTDKTQLQFQIPATEYQDQITKTNHAFSGTFDFEAAEIDVAFTHLSSHVASVTDPQRSHRLTFSFSPEFSTLVFWTVKGKDFYCLEPWSAPRNALNTGDRLLYLEPGASLETEFKLMLETVA